MKSVSLMQALPESPATERGSLLSRQPRWLILLALSLVSLGIGWVDFITGWEWSLFVLYAVPILAAVWWSGRNAGLAMAVLSAAIWWVANQADNPYQTTLGYTMAMFSRFVYFVLAAFSGAAVRSKQAADAAQIKLLEEHRRLEHDIVAVSEREQQRIGQDLHDGLCQQLAAIGCASRALADDLQSKGHPEAADAAQIEAAIQNAVIEARSMARGIYPVHVDRSGLSTALEELARINSRLTGVPITVTEGAEVDVQDPDVAMHLYRITQEAVANAVRHSGARRVTISLHVSNDKLDLCIRDDGIGIAVEANESPGDGMGLRTMRYRAQALGATLTVEPASEGGTLVHCQLKVRTQSPHPHGQAR